MSTPDADADAETELNLELEERFAAGKGVINLSPLYTDAQILTLIKIACRMSQGAAFQVVPTPAATRSTNKG